MQPVSLRHASSTHCPVGLVNGTLGPSRGANARDLEGDDQPTLPFIFRRHHVAREDAQVTRPKMSLLAQCDVQLTHF
jgi:hypothetical protein